MEILIDKTEASSLNVPKLSSRTFEIRNNYYVVTDGTTFNYYTIKVKPSDDASPLIRFEKSPPVLLEGVAIVNSKVYNVTVADLLRRIIRKSREIIQEASNATTTGSSNGSTRSRKKSTLVVAAGDSGSSVQDTEQPATPIETEMEIGEAADFAWSEQIGTLLSVISEKEGEEWEVTPAPQS